MGRYSRGLLRGQRLKLVLLLKRLGFILLLVLLERGLVGVEWASRMVEVTTSCSRLMGSGLQSTRLVHGRRRMSRQVMASGWHVGASSGHEGATKGQSGVLHGNGRGSGLDCRQFKG